MPSASTVKPQPGRHRCITDENSSSRNEIPSAAAASGIIRCDLHLVRHTTSHGNRCRTEQFRPSLPHPQPPSPAPTLGSQQTAHVSAPVSNRMSTEKEGRIIPGCPTDQPLIARALHSLTGCHMRWLIWCSSVALRPIMQSGQLNRWGCWAFCGLSQSTGIILSSLINLIKSITSNLILLPNTNRDHGAAQPRPARVPKASEGFGFSSLASVVLLYHCQRPFAWHMFDLIS
ncbi:hypothetical protein LY78DRAFT_325774 [Colletotrichum sublineola]|nr:hypothetical protein LY78DRAFT_325774 [Colletotrichum sublineola]